MSDLFVGRELEAKQLQDALDLGRTVSVYGQLGVGKSALVRQVTRARAATADQSPREADHIWKILDLRAQVPPRTDGESRHTNWVFDNADGALTEVTERIREIRLGTPNAKIIVTSCEPLLHPDVTRLELAPLGVQPGGDACALFAQTFAACKSQREHDTELTQQVAALSVGMPEILIAAAIRAAQGERKIVEWIRHGEYLDGPFWHGTRSLRDRLHGCWKRLSESEQRVLLLLSQWENPVANTLVLSLSDTDLAACDRLASLGLLTRSEDRTRCAPSPHVRAYARALTQSSIAVRSALLALAATVAGANGPMVLDLDAERSPTDTSEDCWTLVPMALEGRDYNTAVALAFHASRIYLVKGPIAEYDERLSALLLSVPEDLRPPLFLVRGLARLFGGVFQDALVDFNAVARSNDRIIRLQAHSKLALTHGLLGRAKDAANFYARAESALQPRDPQNLRGMVLKDRANVLVEFRDPHAAEYIARARLCFAKASNARELLFLEMLEATRACDTGDGDTVERAIGSVIPKLIAQNEVRRLARARIVLGVSRLDQGRTLEALLPLTQALEAVRAVGDSGTSGQVGCYLAQCRLDDLEFRSAIDYALLATEELQHLGEEAWCAQAWILLASAYLAVNEEKLATDSLQNGIRLARSAKPSVRRTVTLELAKQLSEAQRGRIKREAVFGNTSEEERSAARTLRVVLGARSRISPPQKGNAIKIRRDGYTLWDKRGKAISLARFPVLQSILKLLVEQYELKPGTVVRTERVIAVAWPNERIMPAAAKNRLYVAIRRLRVLGLESVIEALEGGYMLSSHVQIEIVAVE